MWCLPLDMFVRWHKLEFFETEKQMMMMMLMVTLDIQRSNQTGKMERCIRAMMFWFEGCCCYRSSFGQNDDCHAASSARNWAVAPIMLPHQNAQLLLAERPMTNAIASSAWSLSSPSWTTGCFFCLMFSGEKGLESNMYDVIVDDVFSSRNFKQRLVRLEELDRTLWELERSTRMPPQQNTNCCVSHNHHHVS